MVTKKWAIGDMSRHPDEVFERVKDEGPQEVAGDQGTFVIVTAEEWRRRLGDASPPADDMGEERETLSDIIARHREEEIATFDEDEAEADRRRPFAWVNDATDEEFDAWVERMEQDRERRRALYGSSDS